jgi:hypothetical protein
MHFFVDRSCYIYIEVISSSKSLPMLNKVSAHLFNVCNFGLHLYWANQILWLALSCVRPINWECPRYTKIFWALPEHLVIVHLYCHQWRFLFIKGYFRGPYHALFFSKYSLQIVKDFYSTCPSISVFYMEMTAEAKEELARMFNSKLICFSGSHFKTKFLQQDSLHKWALLFHHSLSLFSSGYWCLHAPPRLYRFPVTVSLQSTRVQWAWEAHQIAKIN